MRYLLATLALVFSMSTFADRPDDDWVPPGHRGDGDSTTTVEAMQQTAMDLSNKTVTISVGSAASTGGVPGECLAAYGMALQGKTFGISFGANRKLQVCFDRQLAAMLYNMGMVEEAQRVIRDELAQWQRRADKRKASQEYWRKQAEELDGRR